MDKYVIAVDQSTSATKTILVDGNGKIVTKAAFPHASFTPDAEWVEQDAMEIYHNTVLGIKKVLEDSGIADYSAVKTLGVTNQTGAFVIWDKNTGLPVHNIIGWQARLSQAYFDAILKQEKEAYAHYLACEPTAYSYLFKLKWILENQPELFLKMRNGEILFGTMDSWLVWKLTNGEKHVIDYGNACVVQIMNALTLTYPKELFDLLGIPMSILPQPTDADGDFGVARIDGLPDIPICGVLGDSNAALFSQMAFNEGDIKVTYGTGASMLFNKGDNPVKEINGLGPSMAWRMNGKSTYVLEGTALCAGDCVNWLQSVGVISSPGETEALALSVPDSGGIYFVPAFSGLGPPKWNSEAKACIVGMQKNTTRAHLARAALEGVAYQIADIFFSDPDSNAKKGTPILADGTMTQNAFLMQFQADIIGTEIVVSAIKDSSAMGAAYLAGINSGVWENKEALRKIIGERISYKPKMSDQTRESLYAGWKEAVSRAY